MSNNTADDKDVSTDDLVRRKDLDPIERALGIDIEADLAGKPWQYGAYWRG